MNDNDILPANKKLKVKKRFVLKREWISGYAFIIPMVLGLLIFEIGPILYSFLMSFMKWDSFSKPIFIGLKNYTDLFHDDGVKKEFINTMYYTLTTVPITVVISLLLANALNQHISGKSFYRTIYFIPYVTIPVAVAVVWQWLFNSKVGLIDQFLGYLHLSQPMWLVDKKFIMPAIIIVTVWSTVGYQMVLLLAGMQGIPKVYYEAADIDGASSWKKFVKVTTPLLTPYIFFVLTTSLIDAFKAFDIIYMFAGRNSMGSDPRVEATKTLVYGIFDKGFVSLRMGYACAEAVFLFVIILIVTLMQFVSQKKWVYYE